MTSKSLTSGTSVGTRQTRALFDPAESAFVEDELDPAFTSGAEAERPGVAGLLSHESWGWLPPLLPF